MRRAVLAVLALLAIAHLYHLNSHPRFTNPNVASRVYLTLAIVDHGSLRIDPYLQAHGDTLDKAEHHGHYYSDKAPGLSLWLVPLAWVLRHTLVPAPEYRGMEIALRFLGLTLPVLLFWAFALRSYAAIARSERAGLAVVVAGALGTNFLVFATNLFGHVPAACLLFLAFLTLRRLREGRCAPSLCALSGFLLGAAFVTDYVVVLAVLVFGLYGLWWTRRVPLHALAYVTGALAPLAVWMAMNTLSFGDPLTVGFQLSAYPEYRRGYGSGLAGVQIPDPRALWEIWFSRARGMLFLSPFLALAPVGLVRLWRERSTRHDAVLAAAAIVGVWLFASTTLDWRGGWSAGVRYLVPAVPFLLLGVSACLEPGPRRSARALALSALAIPGLALVGAAAATFPFFPDVLSDPLWQLAVPLSLASLTGRSVFDLVGVHAGILPWACVVACAAATLVGLLFEGVRARVCWGLGSLAIALALLGGQWASASPPSPEEREQIRIVLHCMGYRGRP